MVRRSTTCSAASPRREHFDVDSRDAAAGAADRQHGGGGRQRSGGRDDRHRLDGEAAGGGGQAHIIGWAGDIVPYQITAVFTTAPMIAQHADVLKRFARAYQKGVADYREAFLRLDAQGKPIVDATTDAVIPLIEKYVFTGDPKARDKIIGGVGYYDAGGALDVADVIAQLDWFKAQGLVKGDADPQSVIDTRSCRHDELPACGWFCVASATPMATCRCWRISIWLPNPVR